MMINLDGMTARKLRELKAQIDSALETKQREARVKLRDEFAVMAIEAGTSLAELFGTKRKVGQKTTPLRDRKTGVVYKGKGPYPAGFDKARAEPVG